ncbi:uncharacterized protein V6R79_003596 [Siganus canaliculatus]
MTETCVPGWLQQLKTKSEEDCGLGSHVDLGELAEGYEGVVEEVTGIPVGHTVSLVSYRFPEHLDFVGLSFTPGETNVIVRTRKPLDADVLGDTLYYTILCEKDSSQHNNKREIKIIDNGPIFEKDHYSASTTKSTTATAVSEDNRGLKDTATALIQDEDFDDLNLSFSHNIYRAFIQENQSGPFRTIEPEQIKAQDGDTGIDMTVTYSISEVFPDQYTGTFSINSSTGVVSVETPIDREEMTTEVILVSIKASQTDDKDSKRLKDTAHAVVSVTVEDVNDNAPQFDQTSYSVSLMENSPVDDVVFRVTVTDKDQGGFEGSLRILESVPFSIDPDGTVRVNDPSALDRETTESFTFEVVAVDQATDGLNSTAQFTITVLDYNDNTPQFPEIPDPLQISEGNYTEAAPGEIFSIVPTDADVGLNGEVTVSLASPHPLFSFREDGMLLAVGSLDRESREMYELIIKASDKGSPQRESFTTVRVNLTDVNDNRPEFSSGSYVSSILLKDAVKGKLLLTLSATDRDVGSNALITYSFPAGLPTYLALNNETGAVTLTSDLVDITEDTTQNLTAMAEDHGQPPLSSTASVTVHLRVSNTVEDMVFITSSYSFIVRENQPAGAAVGRVFATSGSDRYNVTYSLKNNTDLFNISTDGSIQTRVTLDKEEEEWYVLDVEAVDTRTPPTSAVAKVTVQVEDINESPYFQEKEYNGSVFSIAPYKTPIIQVQASDPDLCDSQLVYSMTVGRPHFSVEPSTGLVYLVSTAGLNQSNLSLEVQATDRGGLQATVKVEVEIWTSTSGDKVTLWLSLTADTVKEHWEMLEVRLGEVLGYTVTIIEVAGVDGEDSGHSLVTFIATLDNSSNEFTNNAGEAPEHFVEITKLTRPVGGTLNSTAHSTAHSTAAVRREVVSSELVIAKVNSEAEKVKEALAEVFGEPVAFAVNQDPQGPDQTIHFVAVVLGVLLGLSMLGLTLASVFIMRNRKTEEKNKGEDTSSLDFPVTFKGSGSDQNRNKRKEKKHKDEDTGSFDFPVTFKRSRSYQKRMNDEVQSEDYILKNINDGRIFDGQS